MTRDVRVVINEAAIRGLADDQAVRDLVLEAAAPVVSGAQDRAPRRTGAGAASIRAEAVLDGPEWTARVSWTQQRFYLYFHERGSVSLPARPFLVPTLEGLAR